MQNYGYPKFKIYNDSRNVSLAESVPAEIFHMIDPYWYQYPPMKPLWFGIISFVISVLGVMSLTGNFVVIYVFISAKSLRTSSNLFVVNLAVSDFCMMFTMFPPVVLNGFYGTWILGPFLCELYGLFGSLFGCVSIWTMTMIALDRYNVIVKGITKAPLSLKGAILRIAFVWFVCGCWALVPLFGWNRYVPEGNMTACGTDYFAKDWFNRSYIIVYSTWAYVIPLKLIIFSYYHILKALPTTSVPCEQDQNQGLHESGVDCSSTSHSILSPNEAVRIHEAAMREQAKKMNVQSLRNADDKAKSVEIKLAKVALCTIALWFVAWTPYSIINYAGIFNSLNLSPLSTICGSVFAKANSVCNPIVYGLSHPKYKQVLREKMPWLTCSETQSAVSDTKTQATTEITETAA